MGWPLRGKFAIVGYGETKVNREKKVTFSMEQYYAQAAKLALDNAGLTKKDFDGQGIGLLEPETIEPIWSMQIIQDLGLHPKILLRSDHGGIGSGVLLEQAAAAINAGLVDRVLCIGADPIMTYSATGATITQKLVTNFMRPFGMMGPNSIFGCVAQRYIHQYGVTPEQVGKLAITQRYHATLNPLAYFHQPITMEDYLNSRMISDPIRLYDCCIGVNGGLSFIVTSSERGKDITDKPVYLLGSGTCYNYRQGSNTTPDITYMGTVEASKDAFARADIKRGGNVSFVQTYDDYTYASMIQIEDLGFCDKGDAGRFIEDTDISCKGKFPINTGGGQLSSGQAGMSGSFLPLVEAVRQLRGEGGERQVKDAKIGVVSLIGAIGQYCGNLVNTHVCILGTEVA